MNWTFGTRIVLLFSLFIAVGCTMVSPSNPYDMDTDTDQQKMGHIIGRVELPPVEDYVHDFDAFPVMLMIQDEPGQPLLDDSGEPRVWETRQSTAAMPDRLLDPKNLRPAGTFDIELQPGVYTLIFDATYNNLNYRYADVSIYAITVYPAAYATAMIEPEVKGQPDCMYNIVGNIEGSDSGQGYEIQLVSANDVGGVPLRMTPMSADGPFTITTAR